MAQIESWLGSFTILRGSGTVLLKNPQGEVWTPCPPPPSGSAHALHPPVSKSRANVLLIFQCPGICPTPSQVDILVSDDSLAFCPTMYNRVFTWEETRAKSELRVRLVRLNMLKLSSFFLPAQISSITFLNVKNLAFTPYCGVCVLVVVCVCGGGGGLIRYNHSNIYRDPAIGYSITFVNRCWRVGQWLQMHFTHTTRVGICER